VHSWLFIVILSWSLIVIYLWNLRQLGLRISSLNLCLLSCSYKKCLGLGWSNLLQILMRLIKASIWLILSQKHLLLLDQWIKITSSSLIFSDKCTSSLNILLRPLLLIYFSPTTFTLYLTIHFLWRITLCRILINLLLKNESLLRSLFFLLLSINALNWILLLFFRKNKILDNFRALSSAQLTTQSPWLLIRNLNLRLLNFLVYLRINNWLLIFW